jgi:putative glutamine amidotransferase
MTKPFIGITTYGQNEESQFPLPREYVDAVRRAGGIPLLLPPGETEVDDLLARIDGLILAGGGDLDPGHYDGADHPEVYMVDNERDDDELLLAGRAIDSGMSTFGICRGAQVINVVLGGTLHEHLPDVVGENVVHRLPPRKPTEHAVTVETASRLGGLLGETEFVSASWHHQAIDRVATCLKVVAQAPDGTIEAVEQPDHPWLIGVQWHPELTAATDPAQQRLFDEFVRFVNERRTS